MSDRSVRVFRILFGLALVANVITEALSGVWHVHDGTFYPWHHLPFVGLYPAWALAVEWTITALAGVLFAMGHRHAAKLAAVVLLVGLSQRYSNHAALLFLVALFSTLDLGLVRAQILIVYGFGALNKIVHGFLSGDSLMNLLGLPRPYSIVVVAAEVMLPILLVMRPRIGLVGVVAMHLAFSVFMPGLSSFALCMIAMAVLWIRPSGSPHASLPRAT